jgi:hypothetical protein
MRWMILPFLLCSIGLAFGQDAPTSQTGAIPYFLRLERLRPYVDVCILVRSDGQYHLEILEREKIRILEGTLSNTAMDGLRQTASSEKLAQLQQQDIRTPLVESGEDEFLLSILRPGRWQNLRFADEQTREPYRELLDPFLKWLGRVPLEKAKSLTEEAARSNCLPPARLNLKTRFGENAISESRSSAELNRHYLLRTTTRQFDAGRLENSCVLVSLSGAYHYRRSQRIRNREIKTVVIDGILSQDAFRSLRSIVDAEALKRLPAEKPPNGQFLAGTLTSLWIPREATTQEITAWRLVYLTKSPGGGTDLPQMIEHHSAVLKPLNEWFKTILGKEHEVQVKDPANPQCLPEAQ